MLKQKTINSNRIIGSYVKPEKQERIDLLHRLLMEAKPSGSDLEPNQNAVSQINILNDLGIAYQSLSQFNRSIELFQQALEISQKIADRNAEAASLCNLGNMYYSLSHYQQAILYYQQSLDISKEIGNRSFEINSLNGLGLSYYSLGQYQQAIQFHQQSLEITRQIANRNGEANSLCNLGNVYD